MDDEADLLHRLQSGAEGAFTELVGRYHSRLVRFAASFVASSGAAQDVAQETWIGVLKGMDSFQGRSSLSTWIFQICANQARSAARGAGRVIPVEPGEGTVLEQFDADGNWLSPPQAWAHSLSPDLDDEDLVRAVRDAITQLPVAQRQVVTLRDVEGLSAAEVCSVLAITEANQRVLLHRGRTRVRAVLDQLVRRR